MTKITSIALRRILNSRGNETIEAEVYSGKTIGRAASPAGASVGKAEAIGLPKQASKLITEAKKKLVPKLKGIKVSDQKSIDAALKRIDGTENFSKIGGSISISVSMAALKCAAALKGKPLYKHLNPKTRKIPIPLGNVFGGGKHALVKRIGIQEILVLPLKAKNIEQALFSNAGVEKDMATRLKKKGVFAAYNDENALSAQLTDSHAFDLTKSCLDKKAGSVIGTDVAASSFYKPSKKKYFYKGTPYNSRGYMRVLQNMIKKNDLYYIEDPFEEDSFGLFAELLESLKGENRLICGDDLTVTNPERISKAVKEKAMNAVIIKPNQVGTISDTIEAVKRAKKGKCVPVLSHRSGETCDNTISHLAVGLEAPMIKAGVSGGERTAKLNELVRISETMKNPVMAKIKTGSK